MQPDKLNENQRALTMLTTIYEAYQKADDRERRMIMTNFFNPQREGSRAVIESVISVLERGESTHGRS